MELNTLLRQQLEPKQALIVYRRGGAADNYHARENDGSYIELHPIVAQGEGYALGPGAPLSKRQIAKLASLAVSTSVSLLSGFLPCGRILYLDPSPAAARLVWWRPPEKRELVFNEKQSGIASGEYPLPALVFDLKDKDLSVYAAATATVTPDTALKNTPLPNIYGDGTICMGNCRLPALRGDIASIMDKYEELFYRSEFTHFNNKHITNSPVTTLFKQIAGTDTFPVEELTPLGEERTVGRGEKTTLRNIIKTRRTS